MDIKLNRWYVIPVVLLMAAVPAYLFLFGPGYCPDIEEMPDGNIQVIGDSIFGSDADGCASIAGFMSLRMNLRVTDNAVPGSTVTGSGGIPSQYVSGDWEWTVVDGGGNDLIENCVDEDCEETLDAIMSDDEANTGLMPDLVSQIKADGSEVIIVGYYSVPEGSEFEAVSLELDILMDRYSEFAENNDGVYFLNLREMMSPEDTPEYYSEDLVHPSEEGHEAIGNHIADFITAS